MTKSDVHTMTKDLFETLSNSKAFVQNDLQQNLHWLNRYPFSICVSSDHLWSLFILTVTIIILCSLPFVQLFDIFCGLFFWKTLFIRYNRCCARMLIKVLPLSFLTPFLNGPITVSPSSCCFKTLALKFLMRHVWLQPGTVKAYWCPRKIDLFFLTS